MAVKVALCITARQGGTSLKHLVPSLLAIFPTLVKAGHKVHLFEAEGGELQSSRAEVVAGARAWGADAYYLQDADMHVNHAIPLWMLETERLAVLAPYPRRHGEQTFDVEPRKDGPLRIHHHRGHRMLEVRGGGLGCTLLRGELVDLLWAAPKTSLFSCGKSLESIAAGLFDNIYEHRPDLGGKMLRLGEDWSFWRRVEKVGVTPMALCDVSRGIVHEEICGDFAPALIAECERRGCEGCGARESSAA